MPGTAARPGDHSLRHCLHRLESRRSDQDRP